MDRESETETETKRLKELKVNIRKRFVCLVKFCETPDPLPDTLQIRLCRRQRRAARPSAYTGLSLRT